MATTRHCASIAPRWMTWLVACCMVCALLVGIAPIAAHAAAATSASEEAGLPVIRNFSPKEYGGAPQNWSVIQDRRGVIYVGNVSDGLFAFDGSRWQRIPIPNRSAVRSLAMDANGRIYVGAVGDFGYLEPDAVGQMHFVSLLERVPTKQRQFADVWRTLAGKDGVYFTTNSLIFRFDKNVVKVWKTQTAFHTAFVVNGAVYVREFDRGLMRMTDEGPKLIPGGERFADQKIWVLLPWKGANAGPGDLLIGTRNHGWWRFDGKHYRRWSDAVDAAIKDTTLYDGIWLSNGQIALATRSAGILVLDKSGHVVQHLTRANGLADNGVNSLIEDRQGGLWVTSNIGVSRISINSPISSFDERNGLPGAVLSLTRYQGRVYAGTFDGLFVLTAADSGSARFVQLKAVKGGVWSLLDSGHGLLVGGSNGIYTLRDSQIQLIRSSDTYLSSMLRSRRDPDRIFLGFQLGLSSMRWDGRRWLYEGAIGDFDDEIRSMVEDDQGRLWLGTWNSNVLRVTPPATDPSLGDIHAARMERFNDQQGIPGGDVVVTRIEGQLRIGTASGILLFNPATQRFVRDRRFAGMLGKGGQQTTLMQQDGAGKLWMYIEDNNLGTRKTGAALLDTQGNWRWVASPLQPLAGINMLSITAESDGAVWFSAELGLFRYAPTADSRSRAAFATMLRAISIEGDDRLPHDLDPGSRASIPYKKNAMRFDFAAPSFDTLDANRFETQLEGLDNGWSPWTSEAYRDYTNIPEGNYRFQVRAKNVYGDIGKTASFDFRILPPWYRTWWAWALWLALAALALTVIVVWRSAALRKRNRTLAAVVELRTAELQTAITALSEQSVTDPLTGLKNRRYLHHCIENDVAMAKRQGTQPHDESTHTDMAFLMVDIDHFKEVNDTYGHAAGDRVLQQMRDILLTASRESDTPIRWGGEEFLILARRTHAGDGRLMAERLRAMVAAHPFDLGNSVRIHRTCSIGFASYPFFPAARDALNWEQVVNLADECMYAAKRRGRNGWVGVQAGDGVPEDVTAALHESLERAPLAGPLVISVGTAGVTAACARDLSLV